MRSRALLMTQALLLLLAVCGAAFAEFHAGQSHRLIVPMQNGAFVIFRTEVDPNDSQELPISFLGAESAPDLIHRIFADDVHKLFFGYDLAIKPVVGTNQFRVSVKPLDPEFERSLGARKGFHAHRLHPNFNAQAFSASSQLVTDGDTFTLDVLFNPRTGVKIIDVIKISTRDPRLQESPVTDQTKRDYKLQDVQLKIMDYKLLVNGEQIYRSASGCTGPIVWFSLPGKGRFIFSLTPHEDYGFQKIGTVEHNKISFTLDEERYEWISSSPIVGDGGNWNLWVLHDSTYSPDTYFYGTGPDSAEKDSGVQTALRRGTKFYQKPTDATKDSNSQNNSSSQQPKRVRVTIGAADRIENILPRN